ncbi:hypothetical protein HYALB_00010358 [Hymenoscyphus albidus]|uniref:Uncharacterized protein n=1 Tax=Hymenoscyphus albidus TaxID=595503 RepID=A0A9N9LJI7_9HELO|nr:hypothetical protein HYALB_00010358 [Hymenoscyphus albidus]
MDRATSTSESLRSSTIAQHSVKSSSNTRSGRHEKGRSAATMPTFKEIETLVEERAYNDKALTQANLSQQSIGPSQLEQWNHQPERHEWFAYRMEKN